MKLRIVKNYFSAMCGDWDTKKNPEASHAIFWRSCNFHCNFCNNSFRDSSKYIEYTHDELVFIFSSLLRFGNRFKFSGGEATLNPELESILKIVREIGGYIFLDTNGSNPHIIQSLLEESLLDVVGISLKGLSGQAALEVSGCKSLQKCWDNVFETLDICCQAGVRTIVTYVFYGNAGMSQLTEFSNILKPYPNVHLKINNLLFDKHHNQELKPLDKQEFERIYKDFINTNPEWSGRMIVVNDESAISNYEQIIFL